jgi:hypothetical protein
VHLRVAERWSRGAGVAAENAGHDRGGTGGGCEMSKKMTGKVATEPPFGRCLTGESHEFRFLRTTHVMETDASIVDVVEQVLDVFYCTHCLTPQVVNTRNWHKRAQ